VKISFCLLDDDVDVNLRRHRCASRLIKQGLARQRRPASIVKTSFLFSEKGREV
jgi:hypothetical protein